MRRSFPPIKSSIFSPLVKAAEKFRSRGSVRQVLSEVVPPKEPTRRALLVAINYPNLPHLDRLEGPQRDVEKLRDILINRYQYQQELITILTDKEGISATYYPTRENVLKHLRHFYDGQTPGDQYLFYFAGHSFQYETEDKREEDRKDEFLLPSIDRETFEKLKEDTEKYKDYGIVDDVLAEYLVKPLNDASRLTAIFDTCHSNTLLDLPHHRCNRVSNWKSLFRRAKRRYHEMSFGREMLETTMHPSDQPRSCNGYRDECRRMKGVRNNVICLSACKDSQEVWEHSKFLSMTSLLVNFLAQEQNYRPTLKKTMRAVSACKKKTWLKKREKSAPQLSSRYPARMNSFFYL